MFRKCFFAVSVAGVTSLWASPVAAQDEALTAEAVQAVMDNLWLVIAGCLVFLMQAGFLVLQMVVN